MRKRPYPIAQLTGGLDVSVDPVFLADKNSPNAINIRFDKGLVKKGLGWTTFGTVSATGLPLQGTVMWMDEFSLYTGGTTHYLMSTVDFIYRYISTTKTYQKLNGNTGSNLVASWTNAAHPNDYDTFTSVASPDIAAAILTGATTGIGNSAAITLVTNKWYRILATLTLNSGQAPTLTGTAGVTTTTLANGANTIVFKATGTSCVLTVTNTAACNWACTFTLYLIEEWTGDEDNQFCGLSAIDSTGAVQYIITNGKDDIQKWDGGTTTYFTDLLGWKAAGYFAKQLIYFKNRLVALFTNEGGNDCPIRVRWSIAGNIEDVTGTGSGFLDLADTPDWGVCLITIKDKCYIVKERSIWELVYVGGTTVFTAELRVDGVGSYSPQAIIDLGEEMVFYGGNDVYLYDGVDSTSIGGNIYPYLYETENRIVNSAMAVRVASTYVEELKNFIMCCPPAEGTIPQVYLTYNFDYKAWTRRTKEVTAFGFYSVPAGTAWSALTDIWTAQTWSWSDKPLSSGAPTTLIGDTSGYIYEDDRLTTSTDYMCYETKDFIFDHAVRWVDFRIHAKGGPFQVSYSTNSGTTWSSVKTFSSSTNWTEYSLSLNLTSQKIRFKIECVEGAASSLDIKWIEPWYLPRKRSVSVVTS